MPKPIKLVQSFSIDRDAWRLLRFYRSSSFVQDRIRRVHGLSKNEHNGNVRKQAEQVTYCIGQAEEYFRAATVVGIATRPLLLYYGAVSLGQAVVLLRLDGNYSLDKQRSQTAAKHHGLDLRFQDGIQRLTSPAEVLKGITAQLKIIDEVPRGFFPTFYGAISPPVYSAKATARFADRSATLSFFHAYDTSERVAIETVVGGDRSLLDTIATFPDLAHILEEMGIRSGLAPGAVNIDESWERYVEGPTDDGSLPKGKLVWNFLIDGLTPSQKKGLIDSYQARNAEIKVITEYTQNLHMQLTHELPYVEDRQFYTPDIVENCDGEKYFILDPDRYMVEPAAYLFTLYCFGMLSRYYPDVWMKLITTNSQFSETVDAVLEVVAKKLGMLMLNQLSEKTYLFQPRAIRGL